MKRAQKIILFCLCILIIAAMPLVFYTIHVAAEVASFLNDPFNDKKFNSEIWKQFHENDDPDNPRGQMFADLQKHHLKSDLSKEEVQDLLGEPDLRETETILEYNLGMWSWMRIDYDSIVIEFDETNRLIKSYRVQH